MGKFVTIQGGVTTPEGFLASAVSAGIKSSKPDMALIVSKENATVAGTFTSNKVKGAPVRLCQKLLEDGKAKAIVINSGNANACNGEQGMLDAQKMGELMAAELNISSGLVFVCSTGTIGIPMPMDKISSGIKSLVEPLSAESGSDAAAAIMTTDTVSKEAAAGIVIDGVSIRIGAMAKGAGMIEPNMATMLSFVTTDAAVETDALKTCLKQAVDETFNRISVDGDQSCNDTVLFMANGAAGNTPLSEDHPEFHLFVKAVTEVCRLLAFKIVQDGEGATKFVIVQVKGAKSQEDARLASRAVANSLLVKTSWFGCDPNWGRVIDAAGYSGADMAEEKVAISYDDMLVVENGCAVGADIKKLEAILKNDEFKVTVDLNLGNGEDTVYTCDCSHEYVRINSEYMT